MVLRFPVVGFNGVAVVDSTILRVVVLCVLVFNHWLMIGWRTVTVSFSGKEFKL